MSWTPDPPRKSKPLVSLITTYSVAATARSKLGREANRSDHNLRVLVGHANFLDSLMLQLQEAERERNEWCRSFSVDRIEELAEDDDDDKEEEEDDDDEEEKEGIFQIPLHRQDSLDCSYDADAEDEASEDGDDDVDDEADHQTNDDTQVTPTKPINEVDAPHSTYSSYAAYPEDYFDEDEGDYALGRVSSRLPDLLQDESDTEEEDQGPVSPPPHDAEPRMTIPTPSPSSPAAGEKSRPVRPKVKRPFAPLCAPISV
ncbi:hypothetical protein K470DRAFT_72661 [Piedraia hortae CBS 480.64]|uniref:Uncharacterized protein n=1 Tax=Piedraia hortae CBS 480.64 TaxID=1314780 RepID=A0A6A7BYF8_9PEZI|nr:hypothetical protein K470DRAFT_72661 [Piedraia hortae CBS 480.64]